MTLTDADLDRIEAGVNGGMSVAEWFDLYHDTVPALIAEVRRLRSAQITTLVACSRCGHGQRARNMVAMGNKLLCVGCAGAEIKRLHEWRAQLESGKYGVSVSADHVRVTLNDPDATTTPMQPRARWKE